MAAMPELAIPLGPPPTTELGAPGMGSFGTYIGGWEDNAELRFPTSLAVYDRMRRDAQVDAVLKAADLPIRRTGWRLGTAGVDPRVVKFVADELGLDLDRNAAGRRRRRRQGVVFGDALRHALLCRVYGFAPLEQVYAVDAPGPGQEELGLPRQVAHLRKLAPRMPRSITGIEVATDGGLEAIRQLVPRRESGRVTTRELEVTIPANRLVMFTHDREGGDWAGRSILRSSYGHWLIKQQLLKLGPLIVERNGMGVPVVTYGDAHSKADALKIAKGFRAGEESGAALPDGMTITLVGVTGTLKDELPLLAYHDEAIGRSALAMFLNLGHDNGARALGDTFVDYFLLAETATLNDLEDTFTEYVIRDLVELNYGPDEPYPPLLADELAADAPATAEGLKALTDAGLLDADPGVKAEVRRRFRLPRIDPDTADDEEPTPIEEPPPTLEDDAPPASLTAGSPAAIAQRAAELAQRAATMAGAVDLPGH